MAKGRVADAEVMKRRLEVLEQLLRGRNKHYLKDYICPKYGIGVHALETDITWANKELRLYGERDKDEEIAEHIAKYSYLYEQALSIGDVTASAKMLRYIEELKQWHKQPAVVQTTNNFNLENVTSEDLREFIKKLDDKDV